MATQTRIRFRWQDPFLLEAQLIGESRGTALDFARTARIAAY